MWLIVASAAGSLVYHIPECKPYLETTLKKSAGVFRLSGIGVFSVKTKTPGGEAGRRQREGFA
ncbi:hypothetical protein G8O24_11370 [Bradyrhizobium sp. INPA01-394B]|uniref:Uncharacterized protein n=1 Tax=Bradyrhizobium campsiandrae TaxID=1729892 RepID=A0ABR7U3Z5_9BRAD|nr:hypothetical protein [Bradyrhizobium campsiandrae]MBC9877941.1 hypothetical protein [Bradyrhizobium campsiandrae]MBC9978285.1 hypothetical protein [Bradyrhizobium campsiandrae]